MTSLPFRHAGFFVFRVPILPSQAIEDLKSATLDATANGAATPLHAWWGEAALKNAISLQSPSLAEAIERTLAGGTNGRPTSVDLPLYRYVSRSAFRCTPRGLFAAAGLGRITTRTALAFGGSNHRVVVDLALDYLSSLLHHILQSHLILDDVRLLINPMLYVSGKAVSLWETSGVGANRSRLQVVLAASERLLHILREFGDDRRTVAEARKLLLACGVRQSELERALAELSQRQILVPEIGVSTTALDPVGHLIEQLPGVGPLREVRASLRKVRRECKATQWTPSTMSLHELQRLTQALPPVSGFASVNRFFQIETECRCNSITISEDVVASIADAVGRLRFAFGDLHAERLTVFAEAFLERYGEATVPVLQVLDPERGILTSLMLPEARSRWPLRGRRQAMLRLLHAALEHRAHTAEIDEEFWDSLGVDSVRELQPAFSVVCTVLGASTVDVDGGRYEVLLDSIVGSEGTELWGRLGRFSRKARGAALMLHRRLAKADGNAIRADVLYAPILGCDVAWHPGAHRYTIACSATVESQGVHSIPLSDLYVQIRGRKVRVVSKRLARSVMPVVGSAFDPALAAEPAFRFLLAVSQQESATPLEWDWGDLSTSPFLPRVRYRSVTLAPARWHVDHADTAAMPLTDDAAVRRANWERWSALRRIPDLVAIRFGEDRLVCSLAHPLGLQMLHKEIAASGFARLEEVRADALDLCATNGSKRYIHEMVIPFVRGTNGAGPASEGYALRGAPLLWSEKFGEGVCLPGSEWLYVKLYASPRQIQAMLRCDMPELVSELRRSSALREWFFFRYKDPDWHLRLRFRLVSKGLREQAFGLVNSACARLQNDGTIWRVQYDTYYREIERFGGARACRLVERIFTVESDLALGAFSSWPEPTYLDAATSLATRWVRWTWEQLGLAPTESSQLAQRLGILMREHYGPERRATKSFPMAPKGGEGALVARGSPWQAYARRAAKPLRQLAALAQEGSLGVAIPELAGDLAHLLINRLFPIDHDDAETALYRSLNRPGKRTARPLDRRSE